MRATALFLLLTVLTSVAAQPESVAVFPFASQDARLGMAVADRLASSLGTRVLPPEVTLALVPPFVVGEERFLSPLDVLKGTGSRYAAAVLRDALGTEAAVTGEVAFREGGLELRLHVAEPSGVRSFRVRAPESQPGRLARSARAIVSTALGVPRKGVDLSVHLGAPYGDFVEGLVLLSSGAPEEARASLARAAASRRAEARWHGRLGALRAALAGDAAHAPALAAAVALNTRPLDEAGARRAFRALSGVPPYRALAGLWLELLGAGGEPVERAHYPYGAAQRALMRAVAGEGGVREEVRRFLRGEAPGALLGGLFVAQLLEDPELEKEVATKLSRLTPSFPYPFERLSQLAFDEGDPLAAAKALRVATRLAPQSDLYWTNLGWAYYLLGLPEQSEAASKEALALNPGEVVAWYNLGLVQTVTGRLGEALESYEQGLARDLEGDGAVNGAAVADLEDALTRYPKVPGVHFALATLLEASGKHARAAEQFERYAARAEGELARRARARAQALRTPPPPLEFTPGTRVGLGPDALPVRSYRPGDRLYPRFEVSTPGLELPPNLSLELELQTPSGEVVTRRARRPEVPPAAVALAFDDLPLELPEDLAPGRYRLVLTARAGERRASVSLPIRVQGAPSLLRRLVGRGIVLRDLATGRPLYSPQEAGHAGADQRLIQTLLDELARSASAAGAVPEPARGRFTGRSGEVLFTEATPRDVRAFLEFLLAQEITDEAFTFAEVYARWAVEGGPTP